MKLKIHYKITLIFVMVVTCILFGIYLHFDKNFLRGILGVSLLFVLSGGIVIGFIVSIWISRPISDIVFAVKNIASGNFGHRILIPARDELGELVNALNYMSEQIHTKMEDVTVSKLRLEAVLLSMFEGVMVVDPASRILLINQALRDVFSIKGDVAGRKPIEVIRNVEIQEITDNVIILNRRFETKEIAVIMPEEKILLVHAAPVIRAERIEGAVLVFHDITGLRRLERIRQDFVANVSHELRTPVSSIKGYAETLLEGALEDKGHAKEFVNIIYSSSERLARLIDDILDLSKIESGKVKMALKPCSVRFIVKRSAKGFDKEIKDKSITLDFYIPDDIPKILADEAKLQQVLVNLIDNAVKYTYNKGRICISIEDAGRFVRFNVTDTGIGIPEKDIPRIFERFYRVDKARSRELGGTGLGLSIVKHIVYAHNGEVSVNSIEGKGSTFSFTIPKA